MIITPYLHRPDFFCSPHGQEEGLPGRNILTNPADMVTLAALVDGRQPRQILTFKRR
ncbi:MAG: hypothetical protein WCW53_12665 [Syntrophales bacterium]